MRRLAVLAVLGVIATGLTAAASVAGSAGAREPCPKAESLVPNTHWHHHRLARGVRLAEGVALDHRGKVSMHVVRVALRHRSVRVRPLLRKLTRRTSLTNLAVGHHRLVAAINTGYFDFATGAPAGPIVDSGRPFVMSARHQRVVGLAAHKRMQSGQVWLAAHLATSHGTVPVQAINELHPPHGLAIYTPRWGERRVRLGPGRTRAIPRNGRTPAISPPPGRPTPGHLV